MEKYDTCVGDIKGIWNSSAGAVTPADRPDVLEVFQKEYPDDVNVYRDVAAGRDGPQDYGRFLDPGE